MVTTTPVTIEQAAALMGVSATTIRRRIKAGDLRVTETRRPQGIVWLVHLPPGIHPSADVDTAATASVDTAPSTDPAPASSIVQAEALTGLVQATVATVLGPLVAELGASRQVIERQAQEIADLREDRGRVTAERDAAQVLEHQLRAERDAAQAAHEAILAAQSAPPSSDPAVSAWRRWWLAGLVLAGLVALVLLLAWPR